MLSRANAATYLAGNFGAGANNLLALADIAATDTTGDLKEIIDDAALLVGVSYADLATASVADADARKYLASLKYAGIRRIIHGLNAKSQMGVAAVGQGVSLDVREWMKRLQSDLLMAAAECRALGLTVPVDGKSGWSAMGTLTGGIGLSTDYLEPQEVE